MPSIAQKMPRYVYVLLCGQAINLAAAILTATVTPIVGLKLAPDPSLATIPYGMQNLAMLLSTLPFSKFMDRFGRYLVFLTGVPCLFIAGITGYLAVTQESFLLLCVTQLLCGLFIATANMYRFAATDGLSGDLIARAGTLVIAGGVFAAIFAPPMISELKDFDGYSAVYLSLVGLSVILFVILFTWNRMATKLNPIHKRHDASQQKVQAVTKVPLDLKLLIVLAVTAGTMSYFMKTLMLITSTLHLQVNEAYEYAHVSVQIHVFAMFLPSFIVPYLIRKSSPTAVNSVGFGMIALAYILPLFFAGATPINIGLALLGAGWNFAYSSATSILGAVHGPARIRIQGINETIIAFMATIGAFLPGHALNTLGWERLNQVGLVVTVLLIVFFALLTIKIKKSRSVEQNV